MSLATVCHCCGGPMDDATRVVGVYCLGCLSAPFEPDPTATLSTAPPATDGRHLRGGAVPNPNAGLVQAFPRGRWT